MAGKYTLLTPSGSIVGTVKGTLGGHRKLKLYGRLDCRSALQAIAKGGYINNRVFFQDESIAKACGFRPCAVCMPKEYQAWKKNNPS